MVVFEIVLGALVLAVFAAMIGYHWGNRDQMAAWNRGYEKGQEHAREGLHDRGDWLAKQRERLGHRGPVA